MSETQFEITVAVASDDDAPAMVSVIHAAFGARPPLDPPSTAIDETPQTLRALLARETAGMPGVGIYATVDGQPAGVILLVGTETAGPDDLPTASLQRVSVHPDFQRHGIASAMVTAALDVAAAQGYGSVELFARGEFAELISFWQHRGFALARDAPYGVILRREVPLLVDIPDAEAMQALGQRLAGVLQGGDVIIASGELGAGKTTFTQGLGAGLGMTDAIISPTFVLSRVHHSAHDRPDLVHVDAYRLTSASEVDDLDLDTSLARSVTVVEWGEGVAERLSPNRLEVMITATPEPDLPDLRAVLIRTVGPRWDGVELRGLLTAESAGAARV